MSDSALHVVWTTTSVLFILWHAWRSARIEMRRAVDGWARDAEAFSAHQRADALSRGLRRRRLRRAALQGAVEGAIVAVIILFCIGTIAWLLRRAVL